MRFIHTADLHLGRMLGDVSMLEDQRQALIEIASLCRAHKADALLIAGDVYQRSAPQAEAMELFNDFVSGLVDDGIRVFAISGNHDSAQRISYFSRLIRKSGVYVSENFEGKLQSIPMRDEYGEITVHLLPYIRPSNVRLCYPEEKIDSYTDAVKRVVEKSNVDFSARNVLVAHQFITGGEMAGSEEKTVGTLDNVDLSAISGFDYVALGHLHRPQRLGSEAVRYAGSPLKYSFGESNDKKSAVLVELRQKGDMEITLLPIPFQRDVRRVEGAYADLMAMPYSEDYLWVSLTDEEVPVDAGRMLKTVFPNLRHFTVSNSKTKLDMDISGAESVADLDAEGLFSDFYAEQNNGVRPGEAQMALFKKLFTWEEKRA